MLTEQEEAFAYSHYLAEQAAAEAAAPPEDAAIQPVNGDASGIAALESQVTEAPGATAMVQLDPTVPLAEGSSLVQPGDVAITEPPAPIVAEGESLPVPAPALEETATTAPAEPAAPTTWQAHDIDLDTIQRKLTRHKYYTPNEVLADIALIEENAKHTTDPDRQLKISEMAAHAHMHVQSFDPKWTPEFEHYAQRMRARKAERAKAKAASRAATRPGSVASGTPTVAPVDGADGVTDAATNGKRDREEDDENAERAKRPRDGNSMDVDPAPITLNGTPAAPATADGPQLEPTQLATQEGSTQRTSPPATQQTEPLPESAPAPAEAAPPKTPTPEPVYPPLVVPEDDLEALSRALKHSTGQLNVEELEQLRASLLDRVWRARKEWDRTALLASMRDVVSKYVAEAAEARRAMAAEFM